MALNIKNTQIENLVTELMPKVLQERRDRIQMLLQNEIWPQIPTAQKGMCLTKAEEAAILGYGEVKLVLLEK